MTSEKQKQIPCGNDKQIKASASHPNEQSSPGTPGSVEMTHLWGYCFGAVSTASPPGADSFPASLTAVTRYA